jgi:hypothetical protein
MWRGGRSIYDEQTPLSSHIHTHVTSHVPPLPLTTHMKHVSIQHDKAVYALHFTHLSIQVMINTSFWYAVKKTRLVFVLYNVLM